MEEEKSTKYKIARRISDVFNAMTFGLIMGILLSFCLPQLFNPWLVFLVAFFLMAFAPSAVLVWAIKKGKTDFDFTDRESRTPFYIATEASYLAGVLVFSPLILPSWPIFCLALVSSILTGLMTLINLKWKISAHLAGAAGPATGIAYVFGPWTLLLTGPVVVAVWWSRIYLKKHTPLQTLFGLLLAVACYTLVFLWLYNLSLF